MIALRLWRPVLTGVAAFVLATGVNAPPRPVDLLLTTARAIDVVGRRIRAGQSMAMRGDTIVALGGRNVGAVLRPARTP